MSPVSEPLLAALAASGQAVLLRRAISGALYRAARWVCTAARWRCVLISMPGGGGGGGAWACSSQPQRTPWRSSASSFIPLRHTMAADTALAARSSMVWPPCTLRWSSAALSSPQLGQGTGWQHLRWSRPSTAPARLGARAPCTCPQVRRVRASSWCRCAPAVLACLWMSVQRLAYEAGQLLAELCVHQQAG